MKNFTIVVLSFLLIVSVIFTQSTIKYLLHKSEVLEQSTQLMVDKYFVEVKSHRKINNSDKILMWIASEHWSFWEIYIGD